MKQSLASEWWTGFLLLGRFVLAVSIAIVGPLYLLGGLFIWLFGDPERGPVYLLVFPGALLIALGVGPVVFYRVCRFLQIPVTATAPGGPRSAEGQRVTLAF
jgi:hypothetical protein